MGKKITPILHEAGAAQLCVCVRGGGGSRFSNGIIIIMSHNINPLYFAAGSCVAMYCSYI